MKKKTGSRNARLERIQVRLRRAQTALRLNAALWLATGAWYVWRMIADGNTLAAGYVFLFFLISASLLLLGATILEWRYAWVYAASIAIVVLNLLLTFFGFPELPFLLAGVLNLVVLAGLIPLRAHYREYA